MTITERITARLDAMEAAARAVRAPQHWSVYERPTTTGVWASDEGPGMRGRAVVYASPTAHSAAHIAIHDPAAVLGLVDGLRKVVALHQPIQMLTGPVCTSCGDADEHGVKWPCPTLDALAAALDPRVGDGREVRGE